MLKYLFDTNIVSDLIRRPGGPVAGEIARVGEVSIATSIVVASELRYGALKSGSDRLIERLDRILSAMTVLPLEPPVDKHYAEIRFELARAGTPIGPNDLLIAGHARALELVVVTANEREFRRVPGLRVENWLAGE